MENSYDLLILGGGPAGLAAGMYGARARMKTAIIEKGRPGGQAATTEELENYPGFGPGTTGPGLTQAMADHAESFGAEFIKDTIVSLELTNNPKKITGKKGEYFAKAVIFALGAEPRLLNVEGEGKFRGKGVSYCATCDADLFEELDVAVVGSGDAAIEEAEYLTKFAETVTMIVIHEEGKVDANQVSAERAFKSPRLKWIWNSTVKKINGDGIVESLTLKNIKSGEESQLPVNGVFIYIGTVPKTELVKGVLDLTPHGYVFTDEKMATNVEGVFAAGDIRDKYLRQVVTAASDGSIAAVAAERYIHDRELWDREVLKAEKPVVVVYYNPTDMEGTEKAGLVDRFIEENPDRFSLVKVDATRNELVKTRYQIKEEELPLVQLFVNGEVTAAINQINIENLKALLS
ncbi:MAG: thioredoxin-disulfide reductase [Syntrophomonadaceae bacterium]|nr:thioredoxin-disulfide reductase [Syntrophomonadaceae bacterium]